MGRPAPCKGDRWPSTLVVSPSAQVFFRKVHRGSHQRAWGKRLAPGELGGWSREQAADSSYSPTTHTQGLREASESPLLLGHFGEIRLRVV